MVENNVHYEKRCSSNSAKPDFGHSSFVFRLNRTENFGRCGKQALIWRPHRLIVFSNSFHTHANELMLGKKSKKPSKIHTSLLLGIPTNVAVGPLGFRAALDINPKGERNRPYRELSSDRPDSTAIIDVGNPEPSRIVFCERKSGAQEPPVPGTSSAPAIHNIEGVDPPMSECYQFMPPQTIFTRIPVSWPTRRKPWLYELGGRARDKTGRYALISSRRS